MNKKTFYRIFCGVVLLTIALGSFIFSIQPVIRDSHVPSKPLGNKDLKLVDISLRYNAIGSAKKVNLQNLSKTVVWFNKPEWINIVNINIGLNSFCPEFKCTHTQDRKNITTDSAIIFYIPLGNKLPFNLTERNSDQAWIYFGKESPVYTGGSGIMDNVWLNTMNWSMNYRLDADILAPYGSLDTRHTPLSRDYDAIFDRKWHDAIWAVSHCNTHSGREKYVKLLQDSNLQVII